MDLATIEPALCALAATLSGLAPAACVFENAPRPVAPAVVLLSWVSRSGVGLDGTAWSFEDAADALDEMTPATHGAREGVLQVAAEVYADQRAGHNASAIVERMRTRFSWERVAETLRAVDLAVATVGPATMADYVADGRMVSRSLFEVRLNAIASEADTDGRTSYIATVELDATVRLADGTALPSSLQPTG